MIVDKISIEQNGSQKEPDITPPKSQGTEEYTSNSLVEVFRAIQTILSEIRINPNDPESPLLFNYVGLNNGQVNRVKNNKWNQEYAIAFPAAFLHFINVRYLVKQSRVNEGRAELRIQFVLNTLNNSDKDKEIEGYDVFQLINSSINKRKGEFQSLKERFQLTYFDQPESFDDGLQVFWITYEVWFTDYSSYKDKEYELRYLVIPPFTNNSDLTPENNPDNKEDVEVPDFNSTAAIKKI